SAAVVWTRRMRAWGTVARTTRRYAMRAKSRSSAKSVRPVTLARPSTRRNGVPMTRPGRSSGRGAGLLRTGSAMLDLALRRIGQRRAVQPLAIRRRVLVAAEDRPGPLHRLD